MCLCCHQHRILPPYSGCAFQKLKILCNVNIWRLIYPWTSVVAFVGRSGATWDLLEQREKGEPFSLGRAVDSVVQLLPVKAWESKIFRGGTWTFRNILVEVKGSKLSWWRANRFASISATAQQQALFALALHNTHEKFLIARKLVAFSRSRLVLLRSVVVVRNHQVWRGSINDLRNQRMTVLALSRAGDESSSLELFLVLIELCVARGFLGRWWNDQLKLVTRLKVIKEPFFYSE